MKILNKSEHSYAYWRKVLLDNALGWWGIQKYKEELYIIELENHILFLFAEKRAFLNRLVLPIPPLCKNTMQVDCEFQYWDEVITFVKRNIKADRIIFDNKFYAVSNPLNTSVLIEGGHLIIQLQQNSEEDILSKFKSGNKQEIKKFNAREGVELVVGPESLTSALNLIESTLRRNGVDFEERAIIEKGSHNKVLSGIGLVNGELASALVVLLDEKQAYYFMGGSSFPVLDPGAGKALQWKMLQHLKAQGVEEYNLGGYRKADDQENKFKGIANYKLSFGPDKIEGCWPQWDLNKLKCMAFDVLLKLKTKFK